jgi:hypothetical protein
MVTTRLFLPAILSASAIALSSFLPAIANPMPIQYNSSQFPPASDRGRPRRTTGAGSRGCEAQAAPVELTLLAPSHTAVSASGRPSFYWHISNSTPVSLRFTLVEPRVFPPLVDQEIEVTEAGIIRFEMPTTAPQLQEGKEYRWTVAVICDRNRPSTNIVAKSLVQHIAPSSDLTSQLVTATSAYDHAQLYAQAGYWYDALDAIALTYTQQPDLVMLDNLLAFLQQAELTQITAQDWQNYTNF